MMLCSKRHMTYLALTFPAVVYLFLMFTAIGQVCFKAETDQSDFKERYFELVSSIQRSASLESLSDTIFTDDSIDMRKLLHDKESHILSYSFSESRKISGHSKPTHDLEVHKTRPALLYNCSSISKMKIRNKIGHGVSKQAFIADYQGTQVAIKMVTRHVYEVKSCIDQLRRLKSTEASPPVVDKNKSGREYSSLKQSIIDSPKVSSHQILPRTLGEDNQQYSVHNLKDVIKEFPDRGTKFPEISASERQRCYTFPTARVMKEILLSEQLHHHNLATLLGYCVRSEESDSTDISEHGVISVYELGSRFVLDNLQILPWQARLRHAIEMADLLSYLHHSPLGSLVVPDFKEGHLVMVNGSLKLIDLDDVNNLEPECEVKDNTDETCPYSLRCVRALCEGFNAKENLKNMNRLVLKRLLFPLTFPESVVPKIGQLNADLDSLKLDADELKMFLLEIQNSLLKVVAS